jgi:CubicO group peptidase (beta-lactamase class C family)
MTSTTTDRMAVTADRLATRHRLYDGNLAPLRTSYTDKMLPAGAMHSTVGDMAKWLSFHLRGTVQGGRQLMQPDSLREMHALHQSIPLKPKADADVYDARFVGTGLGWYVRDYRGRKVVQHGGAWGAEMAIVPEENLGVVALSNRDGNGLVWMLIYDVIDAYVAGPDQAWSKAGKWERWLKIGGPEAVDRDRQQQRAELEKARKMDPLSLPLAAYAGTYRSALYGDLQTTIANGRLRVQFGEYAASLEHWDGDSFYAQAVIEPFLDWHVCFDIDQERQVRGLEIVHVGWKQPDERFLFVRRSD